MADKGVSKTALINELTRSPHGELGGYQPAVLNAARTDPGFLAHVIAWNHRNGQIRDSKVALPAISLSDRAYFADSELADNSYAHLATLDPREFLRSMRYVHGLPHEGYSRKVRAETQNTVERYLRVREAKPSWWEQTVLQHRRSMKTLYGQFHIRPAPFADQILMKGNNPPGSAFAAVAQLKQLPVLEAASVIAKYRIPFLVLTSILGPRLKEVDLVLAMIDQMSPQELVNNTKMLEKLDVKKVPALRAAYEAKLQEAAQSTKATFKATKAAGAVADDSLKTKLQGVQEKQIDKLGGIDGDWLVLGDRSPSMAACIEAARQLAATLARMVKGRVHLVFFDTSPMYYDATGKTYEQILEETKRLGTGSGTSIGVGLQYIMERKFEVDGIAIVSDAQENSSPFFADRYKRYCEQTGKEPSVYLYRFAPGARGFGDRDLAVTMGDAGVEMQEFDMRKGFDYYSLPNIVQLMSANRYSLLDRIMSTPLLTTAQVFAG